MKRKLLVFAAVMVILIAALCASAFAAEIVDSGTCGENVAWTLDSDGLLTISGEGEMENYSRSDDKWHGKGGFIKTVVISDGVTTISVYAFYDCTSLTNVTIPESVTQIGRSAFEGCTSLTNVTIPESVTMINVSAFEGCTALTSVTIGNSLTTITWRIFKDCTSLTSVTIPNSVTTIGWSAFEGCTSLITMTIGNSVKTIDESAFSNCTSLTSVTIPDSVTTIGKSAFSNCISLTSVTIPDSVTTIGERSFEDCTSLISIKIPDNVTEIGSSTFYRCTSLIRVTIPNRVTEIGGFAFCGCTSLTSVTIGNSVTAIGISTFDGCKSLTSIVIPDSVLMIGGNAFLECESLKSVKMPIMVTEIGGSAFRGCKSLENIVIPASVTSIGRNVFEYCLSLEKIVVDENNQYYSSDENGILYSKDRTQLIIVPAGTKATKVVIAENVNQIGEVQDYYFGNWDKYSDANYAFEDCSAISRIEVDSNNPNYSSDEYGVLYNKEKTRILKIPEGMTGDYRLPQTVTELNNDENPNEFYNCKLLENVFLHKNATIWIKDTSYLFVDCSSLMGIWVEEGNQDLRSDENGVLFSEDMREIIQVPCGMKDSYFVPSFVEQIGPHAFYGCVSLDSIYFTGHAPTFLWVVGGYYNFIGVTVDVYYPENDNTWDEVVEREYVRSILTWIPYTPTISHPLGDIDGNGKVENSDLVTVARYIVGLTEGDTKSAVEAYADMNSDGKVDNADIVTVARKIVGLA